MPTLEITSEFDRVREAGDWLRHRLASRMSTTELDDIELAVAEGLTNIVRHAYGERPGQPIVIRLQADPEAVVVTLLDWGTPIDPDERLARGTHNAPDTGIDDLPESGMGLAIMRQLTTAMEYRRVDGANALALTFAGSRPSGGQAAGRS